MDVNKIVDQLVTKVSNDKGFISKLLDNPVKAIEEVTGFDLPEEKVDEVISGVKKKVDFDAISDKVEDVVDDVVGKVKGLF